MAHDDRREIFERLEALERMIRSRSGERGGSDERRRGGRDRHDRGRHDHGHHGHGHHDHDRYDRDDRDRGRGDGQFDEKRIIDTVVQLVGERIERFLQDQQAKMKPRDDDDREKRVVDLVVRLVREHVQDVVSTELDRRLGRPGGQRPAESPPAQHESSEPEER